MGDLAAADPGFDFRQIGILAFDGSIGMHTGSRCRAWAGHVVGTGFAAFGNVLAGESTVQAMAESYRVNHALALDARLLLALDAGRAAGGQAAADGTHLPERSAALMVRNDDIVMDIDLRVDLNDDRGDRTAARPSPLCALQGVLRVACTRPGEHTAARRLGARKRHRRQRLTASAAPAGAFRIRRVHLHSACRIPR